MRTTSFILVTNTKAEKGVTPARSYIKEFDDKWLQPMAQIHRRHIHAYHFGALRLVVLLSGGHLDEDDVKIGTHAPELQDLCWADPTSAWSGHHCHVWCPGWLDKQSGSSRSIRRSLIRWYAVCSLNDGTVLTAAGLMYVLGCRPFESTRDALTIGHPRSSLLAKHGKQRKHAWLRPCTWAMLTSSSTFGSGVCRLITDMSLLFASILDSESHIESRHPLLYANPHLYLNLHSDRTNIDGHSDSAFYSDRDSLEPGQTDHHHFKSSFTRLSQRWTRCWSHANAQRYWH